jgi:hypothetical protein
MKHVLLILLIPIAVALNSCSDSAASPTPETASAPENGAQYKEGKGVTLTPLMAQSIQLKTAEVQEEVIAHSYSATLQATQVGNEASGWLTEEQASQVQPGMIVELGSTEGRVLRWKNRRLSLWAITKSSSPQTRHSSRVPLWPPLSDSPPGMP